MSRTRISYTEIANASGNATIRVYPGAQTWVVAQVSTECSASKIGATSYVRINGDIISKMQPAGDVASGEPSHPVREGGDVMTVTWAGVTVGAVCKATVFYDDGV